MDPQQQYPNQPQPAPAQQAPSPGAFDVVVPLDQPAAGDFTAAPPAGAVYQPTPAAQAPATAIPPQPVPQPAPVVMAPQPVMPQPQMAAAPTVPVASQAPVQPAPAGAKAKHNPNSTQNLLNIAEIRDGIVIMNDGSFRAVIMTKSINFDLMSPQEREAVEYAYQGFLNSLYFDIQIYMRSQRVDIRPYIDKLDHLRRDQDNILLGYLMDDYIDFIGLLAQETNIMDKKFYVIIPFYPEGSVAKGLEQSKKMAGGLFKKQQRIVTINEADLEKAKQELRNRVQATLNGLLQAGLQGVPLDTQELIELYYDTYNPDTATRQQLKNPGDLSAPIIEKGAGMAPQPQLDRELQR